ncbi:MAG TPA: hypothetical protein VKU00_01475, partial [Chthonomonadaceae bacterium]|nr:hypothetical protein [Chthonomonadaceae bacterium]
MNATKRALWVLAWVLPALFVSLRAGTAQSVAPDPVKGSPAAPEIRVEYFGAEPGYAVGRSQVAFLCVVRNVGKAALPENVLRLRCYPLQGLEFAESAFSSPVPRLEPDRAIALRWRLQPTGQGNHLVAAVLVERLEPPAPASGGPMGGMGAAGVTPLPVPANVPSATLTVAPHFVATPAWSGRGEPTPAPRAGAAGREAYLGNDRVAVQVIATDSHLPVWALTGKDGTGWHLVGLGSTMAAVCASEDGQRPWWEMFRWFDTRLRQDRDTATLTLLGSVGSRCAVELTLTARRDTGVIEGRLRLTARKTLRLAGVQFPSLLTTAYPLPAADGTALPILTAPNLIENDCLTASHRGGVTFGLAWPSEPPLAGWHVQRLP